jgi:hypothetical protein
MRLQRGRTPQRQRLVPKVPKDYEWPSKAVMAAATLALAKLRDSGITPDSLSYLANGGITYTFHLLGERFTRTYRNEDEGMALEVFH